ncbi:helix-turn-helix transcriptional regulator [[Clostridium] innocuum]|nr:helix-turn-helix transcriptional regulator [[Clostridium] innocuum]
MKFKDILKSLRIEARLTQAQLGKAINVSPDTIRSYEAGRREPNSKVMVALEKYFDVSGEVLRGELSIEEYRKKIDYFSHTPDVLEMHLKEYLEAFNNSEFYNRELSTRLLCVALKALRFFVLDNPDLDISLTEDILDSMDNFHNLNKKGLEEILKRINELSRLQEYTKDSSTNH